VPFAEICSALSFTDEQFRGGLPGRPDLARGQGVRYFGGKIKRRS